MKHLLMILALVLSGCSTTQVDTRRLVWAPVNEQGKTQESVKMDWEVCRQKAHYGYGDFSESHARCMLQSGYVMKEYVGKD